MPRTATTIQASLASHTCAGLGEGGAQKETALHREPMKTAEYSYIRLHGHMERFRNCQ